MSLRKGIHKSQIGSLEALTISGDPQKETVVLLHGYGADAQDLVSLSQMNPHLNWVFPQAPLKIRLSFGFTGRAWFPVDLEALYKATQEHRYQDIAKAFPPELELARTSLGHFLTELKIPSSKIILGGFSQGAVLSLETALHSASPLASLLIFSGTLVHESTWRYLAPRHQSTTFFQSHGTDDPLLPLAAAQEVATLLQESGLKGELHVFKGGHTIPQSILTKLSLFLGSL